MTPPTLVNLPIEIRSLILNHLSSLSDLAALLWTCTAYYDLYAKSPARYVSIIAVKTLLDDEGYLRDPLAAVWSRSRLQSKTVTENSGGEYKATAIAFLDQYRRAEETHNFDINGDELPIHESLALLNLQKKADYLVDDILDWVKEDLSTPISSSERRRIRRAIYRWQTYRNIFTSQNEEKGDNTSALFDIEQRTDLYFAYMYPWEVEETVVIYDYAFTRYVNTIHYLEESLPLNDWYDRELSDLVEVLIARGPDLLCQVVAATSESLLALARLVAEYRHHPSVPRMHNMWISSWPGRVHAETLVRLNSDWNTRSRLYFEGDDVAESPNAGWVIANQGEVELRFGRRKSHNFRRSGYVFWDVGRVMRGALFDIDKKGNVGRDLSDSRVWPQPSLSALEEWFAPAKIAVSELHHSRNKQEYREAGARTGD